MGSRNALLVFPTVLQMLEAREMPFTDMVTRVYPFEEAAQAFEDWNADPGSSGHDRVKRAARFRTA